jgi:hypothetical protein
VELLGRYCVDDVPGERRRFLSWSRRFNRGDIEAWLAGLDTEVEWHSALPVLFMAGGGVYRGHKGARDMVRNLADVFDELTIEYSEIRDLGDRLLAIGQLHTRGNLSGGPYPRPLTRSCPTTRAAR